MIYHNYIFLNRRRNIFELPKKKLELFKSAFAKELEKEKHVITNSFTTLGLKENTSVLLWMQSDSIETIQNTLNKLLHSDLGKCLKITYTLLGISRPTQYSPNSENHTDTTRKGGKYLIIYPFSKTKEWYLRLDFKKRKELMNGHIAIGRKYPQITQLLLYSYGIDDNEFIVSYETDSLPDFQRLVMDLRSDKVREYTLKDTPIFTCIYRPVKEALNFL